MGDDSPKPLRWWGTYAGRTVEAVAAASNVRNRDGAAANTLGLRLHNQRTAVLSRPARRDLQHAHFGSGSKPRAHDAVVALHRRRTAAQHKERRAGQRWLQTALQYASELLQLAGTHGFGWTHHLADSSSH